jgi:hypothetical protein
MDAASRIERSVNEQTNRRWAAYPDAEEPELNDESTSGWGVKK